MRKIYQFPCDLLEQEEHEEGLKEKFFKRRFPQVVSR